MLGRAPKRARFGKYIGWRCRCSCGRTTEVVGGSLRLGLTKSCGCLRAELSRDRLVTHDEKHSREYQQWGAAKGRCYNKRNGKYSAYGGRGITMCDEWRDDFAAFLRDMGRSPRGSTLGRRNNDGPYAPDNCRWETPVEQANNRRSNRRLTFGGETHTAAEWSRIVGVTEWTIRGRLKRGWTVERALTAPLDARGQKSK